MSTIALSQLVGARVLDSSGVALGRVRGVTVNPQEDSTHISGLLVKTATGNRLLPVGSMELSPRGVRALAAPSEWMLVENLQELFLLERDLLDQQIIDVHGRKVVRVNDVDLLPEPDAASGATGLRLQHVDVGLRGAVRRLLKGVVPAGAVERLVRQLPQRAIPWEFVDLIETDPARRVKLKIEHERLAKLHPADIADILEELAPAERQAVFGSLDEEVAAEALEEIDPKVQMQLLESMDSERAADIVEEMDPDAAADMLADLPPETTEEILEEMEPEEREEVQELLEFREDTAAGRMTTDFISASPQTTVSQALDKLRSFEGGVESISTIFLVGEDGKLLGVVPLAKIALSAPDQKLGKISSEPIPCPENADERAVAELFDKYNLFTLPVVDEEGRILGVITADDVISLLRERQ